MTSARSLWWHVGPYFWPADLTRTANPINNRLGSKVQATLEDLYNHFKELSGDSADDNNEEGEADMPARQAELRF